MRRKYLGDSYDALKRMWRDMLTDWALLYAAPRFIPENLREEFTRLTKITMLPEKPAGAFSVLNDPDIGIRLPGEENQAEGRGTHIALNSIVLQLEEGAQCVITFDQSHYRNLGIKKKEQRGEKMAYLAEKRVNSFYYLSQAPFLFAVPDIHAFHRIQNILKNAGIPESRLENIDKIPKSPSDSGSSYGN